MGVRNLTQTVLVASVATAISYLGLFLFKKWKTAKIPSTWQQVAFVQKIHLYPLKSGRRIELDRAKVTEVGISQIIEKDKNFELRDRVLMVYGVKDNEFRNGRNYPKMTLIDVSVHDSEHLAINAPNMKTLYVRIPSKQEHPVASITCCSKEKIVGIDCGDEAASWFSKHLLEKDTGLRLAYNDLDQRRDITKAQAKNLTYYKRLGNQSTGLFSDLTSASLINQQSVDDLNKRIGNNTEIIVENFRHNFIVDGPGVKPYIEDDWDWIKIGEHVVMRNVKDCTRCISPLVNPVNGVRDPNRQPLKALETYRPSRGPDKGPRMGIHLEVRRTGFVNVGDPVYVA